MGDRSARIELVSRAGLLFAMVPENPGRRWLAVQAARRIRATSSRKAAGETRSAPADRFVVSRISTAPVTVPASTHAPPLEELYVDFRHGIVPTSMHPPPLEELYVDFRQVPLLVRSMFPRPP